MTLNLGKFISKVTRKIKTGSIISLNISLRDTFRNTYWMIIECMVTRVKEVYGT